MVVPFRCDGDLRRAGLGMPANARLLMRAMSPGDIAANIAKLPVRRCSRY